MSAIDQPAFWRPELASDTLVLSPAPADAPTLELDLTRLGGLRAERTHRSERHLVIADPDGDHRLFLRGDPPDGRSVAMVGFDRSAPLRVQAFLRLHRRINGARAGPPPRALRLTPLRRSRLILLLKVLDFSLAGARPREIAAQVIDPGIAGLRAIEWKSSAERRRVMRLIEDAHGLMNGGYRKLLRGG